MARRKSARTTRALVDEYLMELAAARGASAHTLRAYHTDLAELALFLEGRGVLDPRLVKPRMLRVPPLLTYCR